MKKTNDRMMNEWNTHLFNIGCKLRIYEYSHMKIKFNTLYCIEGDREIDCFRQRVKSKNKYMDNLYSNDIELRLYYQKIIRKEAASKAGKQCQVMHSDKIKKNLNTGVPWNKGMIGIQTSWNVGLSKENNESLLKLSESRKGSGNPMFGKHISEEAKIKQSDSIKKLILDGKFTPNIHNSNTHKMIEFNGKKYRSSWEVLFAYLHPEYEYEKIRIPYFDGIKNRIYITDFVDEKNKIIYEIKPKCHKNNTSIKTKISEAIKWCYNNEYTYTLITENELFDNVDKNIFDIFDEHTRILLMRAYETYKKNRN